MRNRAFLQYGAAILAAFALLPEPAAAARRPNLLIIHTDEHNFRTLGCYRRTLSDDQAFVWGKGNAVETENIDALAADGALCANFYATTPLCSPSRAALVSGQYPQENRVLTNNNSMSDDVVTFAAILKREGYATGYAGKWHLDGNGKPQWEPERDFGFEDNRYMFNRGHWKNLELGPDGPRVRSRKGGKPGYDVGDADEKSFATDWLADRTIDFIETHKDGPFCYMVSIPDPHGPDTIRAPYDEMYDQLEFERPRTARKGDANVPSWAKAEKKTSLETLPQYFGMVKCIDDNVGRIMACLERNELVENTIVVFTSDHGDMRGEHGRENKGIPLEASAKVPFIIRYPGHIQPGKIVHEALGCVDFLPTILAIMNTGTAGKESGRDASALFLDKAPAGWNDVAIIRGARSSWVAAVTRRYKLVLSPADDPWLIDKEKDPDERINFAANPEYRAVMRKLATGLAAYHEKHADPSLAREEMQQDLARVAGAPHP